MTSENMTRRGFVGAMGAMGAAGMVAGGAFGPFEVVRADAEEAAGDNADVTVVDGGGTTPDDATLKRALTPSGRLNPVRLVTDKTDEELDALLHAETEVTQDYTTPSGKVIPAVYIRLFNRVNRIGFGTGSEVADPDTIFDWVMLMFSEDDAEHYLEMPMFGIFSPTDYAAVSGRDIDEAEQILADMSSRGLVLRRTRGGVDYYFLPTSEFGFWEANMDRYEEPNFMEIHNDHFGSDYGMVLNDSVRPMCHIGPCTPDVVRGDMVPWTNWEEVIRRNQIIAVSPCQCHSRVDILGIDADGCDDNHPSEACITTGECAQYYIDKGIGRQLTQEEALDLMHSNILDHGLVPELLHTKKAEVICECHSDHCLLLGNIKALNGEGSAMQYISEYNLNYDKATCIKCGACIERCPMEAITFGDDGFCVMDKKCVRCGQCAYVCPVDARWLTAKATDEMLELAEDMAADYLEASRIRIATGAIGADRDFTGAAE